MDPLFPPRVCIVMIERVCTLTAPLCNYLIQQSTTPHRLPEARAPAVWGLERELDNLLIHAEAYSFFLSFFLLCAPAGKPRPRPPHAQSRAVAALRATPPRARHNQRSSSAQTSGRRSTGGKHRHQQRRSKFCDYRDDQQHHHQRTRCPCYKKPHILLRFFLLLFC